MKRIPTRRCRAQLAVCMAVLRRPKDVCWHITDCFSPGRKPACCLSTKLYFTNVARHGFVTAAWRLL